jgi:membrane peptidoglycan carboxypeptidase
MTFSTGGHVLPSRTLLQVTSWMRRRDHNIFANATSLLICGLLAGVVVAAAAFPAAAMSGLAAKAGGQTFAQLPSELKDFSSPQITRIYASDNKTVISQFYDEFRSDVPLKDISPYMRNAIVAAEDREFYHHNGVDLKGVARAFVNNNNGKSKQGASTITMQLVRMSLAYSATSPQEVVDATKDTPKRKVTEMKYALQIEKELNKDQILERYLNIAPFGNQAYGVFAASQVYFNKKPKDLSIAQAAMLAGMVKAPTSFNPTTAEGYPQILARRNNYVIPGMVQMGAITQAQATPALKEPLPKTVKPVGNGCVSVAKNNWGFFCDYFYRWWMSQEAFGPTPYDRERRLKSGGYRVVTTLDVKAQDAARKRVTEQIGDKDKNAILLAAVEPGDGKVRLLAANRKYKLDDPNNPQNKISSDPAKARKKLLGSYPNTTNPLITGGGGINGYQAGSVFKMFTMVAALEKGYPLAYQIKAEKRYKSGYIIESSSDSACPGTHFWCPGNAGEGEAGTYNMWSGFGHSVNTYFVPLEERVGADNVVAVAKRFGVQFRDQGDADLAAPGSAEQWGAFTLGVSASTPLDMANAYATLAGDGMYCEPTPIEQITTQDNEKIDVGKPHCIRATSKDVARAALDATRCPVGDSAQLGSCGGGGTAPQTRGVVNHPVFGKTGTTDKDKTAALIAGTTTLVVAGYMVNPDYQNHSDHMDHHKVNPAVWNTLADAMKGKPKVQFKEPENHKIAVGDQRSIPDVTCASLGEAQSRLESAGFDVSVGSTVDSSCPAGTAADTNPSGRTIKNGVVIIEVSNGKTGQPETPASPDPANPGTPTKPTKPPRR